jgi:hypothetical protein
MSQYRLHIDVPLRVSENEAIKIANLFVEYLSTMPPLENVSEINYRLGHDDDRQKSNYLTKNENGHVNNKKSKIFIKKENV